MSVTPATEPECKRMNASAVEMILHARPRDLGGGFTVRRVLPARERRRVGPFVFWDHMGPVVFEPGQGIEVRPHPHINLATVTYLFEGEIVHKDSLGSDLAIRPGAVNWMTAGRGIVHSERSSAQARREGSRAHGIQSWVALPVAHEEDAPAFHHHPAGSLPELELPGARVRVLAGSAYGASSPVHVFSPMFYAEAMLEAGAEIALPPDHEERAAYVVEGAVECERERAGAGEMIIARSGVAATLRTQQPARVMLLGGAPLDGERHIWWNFVSSSQERIDRAKRDWKEGRFPKVPGDDVEFIPLPE